MFDSEQVCCICHSDFKSSFIKDCDVFNKSHPDCKLHSQYHPNCIHMLYSTAIKTDGATHIQCPSCRRDNSIEIKEAFKFLKQYRSRQLIEQNINTNENNSMHNMTCADTAKCLSTLGCDKCLATSCCPKIQENYDYVINFTIFKFFKIHNLIAVMTYIVFLLCVIIQTIYISNSVEAKILSECDMCVYNFTYGYETICYRYYESYLHCKQHLAHIILMNKTIAWPCLIIMLVYLVVCCVPSSCVSFSISIAQLAFIWAWYDAMKYEPWDYTDRIVTKMLSMYLIGFLGVTVIIVFISKAHAKFKKWLFDTIRTINILPNDVVFYDGDYYDTLDIESQIEAPIPQDTNYDEINPIDESEC
jgi:hypothetical protein